jgi:hypothetical protein
VNNWSSNNNAVFANKGQALDDVTVSLAVTQDLVTENNAGFTLQLNCTPMPGVSVVGIPLTGSSTSSTSTTLTATTRTQPVISGKHGRWETRGGRKASRRALGHRTSPFQG